MKDVPTSTQFILMDPKATPEMLGYWPDIFLASDPRPAKEQANERYAHGGGWQPFTGFKFGYPDGDMSLSYPGDPKYHPFAMTVLPITEEVILFYRHSWVVIVSPDNTHEVARMD